MSKQARQRDNKQYREGERTNEHASKRASRVEQDKGTVYDLTSRRWILRSYDSETAWCRSTELRWLRWLGSSGELYGSVFISLGACWTKDCKHQFQSYVE